MKQISKVFYMIIVNAIITAIVWMILFAVIYMFTNNGQTINNGTGVGY